MAARRRAQQPLGARWDVLAEKAFHDKILEMGPVPLEVLDQEVDECVGRLLAH